MLKNMAKLLPLLALLVLLLSSLFPAHAWRTVSLGTQGDFKYKSWSNGNKQVSVPVQLTYGDYRYWNGPVKVAATWGEDAVAVALVVVHMWGIRDDKGRLVAWYGDAAAGGVAAKTAPPQCTGGIEICYTYKVKTTYKHFHVKDAQVHVQARVFVEAMSKAEAEATVRLMFSRIAIEINFISVVKVGAFYLVEIDYVAPVKRVSMMYDGWIERWEHNFKDGSKHRIGYKSFELIALKSFVEG